MFKIVACGILILCVPLGGCRNERFQPEAPLVEKWDFQKGMDGWDVTPPDASEIVAIGETNVLQLSNPKGSENKKSVRVWKRVRIGNDKTRVRFSVEAMTAIPNLPLDVHVVCQTGKQDGPTYGVLAAESTEVSLTSNWTNCEVVLDIPNGTQEVEFSIGADIASAEGATVDIRSVEYQIESK